VTGGSPPSWRGRRRPSPGGTTLSFRAHGHAVGGAGVNRIGPHDPYAQDSGPYLVAGIGAPGQRYAAADAATGQPLNGRAEGGRWGTFAVGPLLVTTDNHPPAGDGRCTVTLKAVDGRTGAAAWSGTVFSGRKADNTCEKSLALRNVQDIVGSGNKIAAVTDSGRPQLFDLATGRTAWVGEHPGVPIDSDDGSVLVRRLADSGELALRDFATGKSRWSAPDPGLRGGSASWRSAVTPGLVAVGGSYGNDRVCLLVYDAASGKQLGRFPGWLAGAGPDWVAVTHGGAANSLNLDFVAVDR
jgi:hypothetical protein